MSTHVRKECIHGVLVSQCRCAAKDKTVTTVPCPSHCKAVDETTELKISGMPAPTALEVSLSRERMEMIEYIQKLQKVIGDIPDSVLDSMCGDWPAPCNCDDPETHGGHR